MLRTLRERLEALWVQNNRNRIVIMVSVSVVTILLVCGCANLLGSTLGGFVDSLASSGPPVRPTITVNPQQAANVNPTFPLPAPTTYPAPGSGSTPAPSSNTPPPTPTPSPTPSVTDTPTPGGNTITYSISPDPSGRAFKAGVQNTITLQGPPGTVVSVNIFFTNSNCIQGQAPNDPVTLDGGGNGTFSCTIPASLKGSQVSLVFIPQGGNQEQFTVDVR